MQKKILATGVVALSALSLVSCKARKYNENQDAETKDITGSNGNARWVYSGQLPKLERARLTVSQSSHTVRVTGLAPLGFPENRIPKQYAKYEKVKDSTGERLRIFVVYPIATGSKANSETGEFPNIKPTAYRGYEVWKEPDGSVHKVNFGGFPFLAYNRPRGIAFHGPITDIYNNQPWYEYTNEWRLQRGRVSGGCNRMQGEHVMELAHMIGVDTNRVDFQLNDDYSHPEIPITTTVLSGFDKITEEGQFKGKNVNVNYPTFGGVIEPSENVLMFETWSAMEHPGWVCEYTGGGAFENGVKRVADTYCIDKFKNKGNPIPEGSTHVIKNGPAKVYDHEGTAYTGEYVQYLGERDKEGRPYVKFLSGQPGKAHIEDKYLQPLK